MRAKRWLVVAGCVAAGVIAAAPAEADGVAWSGPGYYVDGMSCTGGESDDFCAGPFASAAACDAWMDANTNPAAMNMCLLYATDPGR